MKRNVAGTKQIEYNEEHGIIPQTVYKDRSDVLRGTVVAEEREPGGETPLAQPEETSERSKILEDPLIKLLTDTEKRDLIKQMNAEMLEAADKMEFEKAAILRDTITRTEKMLGNGTQTEQNN